ncbi:MAG: hypothetical protein IPL49_19340 [Saprospirales bacterium]|nr:hypothetical protein [Saprospirales bacterium]
MTPNNEKNGLQRYPVAIGLSYVQWKEKSCPLIVINVDPAGPGSAGRIFPADEWMEFN